MPATRRAVVTGGAGFIGSHLTERLIAEGRKVLVVDNLTAGQARMPVIESAGALFENADIRDPIAAQAIEAFSPQELFHLAAQIDVRRSVADPVYDAEVNVIGTIKMLQAARAVGARFVNTSSGGCIYGEQDPAVFPINEEAAGRPDSPYGISKKVTGDYLRVFGEAWGMAFSNLALANVYGPRQDPGGEAGVVAIFALKLLRNEPCIIYGDGSQTRDFIYVDDVVDAFVAASDGARGETFNIGTARRTSVLELYEAMARLCGVPAPPQFAGLRKGELQNSCLDWSKAKSMLGWSPKTGIEQGLKATIDSFR